ncbi:MAG: succinate dehydrogenase assembly factor 2 [Pelagibacteraceae bacterium]|nr:succinate dehydrogenase assembly factor 2 [Pelagibacteraceae bacterium]|tara:strand:+ start:8983 stop:9237 length:255 start_codon:yes stop_codon:yes gene_type:complete
MKKLEIFKKKLLYRSNYRGTKEMDLLLGNFVEKFIDDFNESELNELAKFLDYEDEIILNYYQNGVVDKDIDKNKISKIFKNYNL